MIKNSGELIALAQPLVFIDDLIPLLVEFGGGKYQRYKWLKWHNIYSGKLFSSSM